MRKKIKELILALILIIGGSLMVYGTVGAVTYIMVPQGGTGVGELESGSVLVGAGTSAVSTTTYSIPLTDGTNGQILKTDGSGALTWQADSSGGGGGGAYPDYLGQVGDVSTSSLGTGYTLHYDGSNWTSSSTLFIDASTGCVGIGTTTACCKLYVEGSIRISDTFYGNTWASYDGNSMNIKPSGDEDNFISFKTVANRPTQKVEGGKFIYIQSSNVYDMGISFRDDDTYSGTLNYEKDTHRMTMLGKASPLGFKANSDYDDYILIQTASNIPEITVASSSGLKINAGGTNDLLLNHSGGDVGIGTLSPNYLLDVNGSGRFNENLIVVATTTFNTVAYKFPASDGSSGQFLTTNASGQLSWTTSSGAGDMLKATYDADTDDMVDTAEDLTCTDCINATEIEDIYLLDTTDTLTGQLTVDGSDSATSTIQGNILLENNAGDHGCYFIYGATTTIECF